MSWCTFLSDFTGKFYHLPISGVTRVGFWFVSDLEEIGPRFPATTCILSSRSYRMLSFLNSHDLAVGVGFLEHSPQQAGSVEGALGVLPYIMTTDGTYPLLERRLLFE